MPDTEEFLSTSAMPLIPEVAPAHEQDPARGVATPVVNGAAISSVKLIDASGNVLASGSSRELGLNVTRC